MSNIRPLFDKKEKTEEHRSKPEAPTTLLVWMTEYDICTLLLPELVPEMKEKLPPPVSQVYSLSLDVFPDLVVLLETGPVLAQQSITQL
ncbi:hypothetical protein BDR04DRAFT_1155665 [Suillus decipiens]|nr:hypothetical protein BDR04DRAFT_1155665 [Suillus decipiens]